MSDLKANFKVALSIRGVLGLFDTYNGTFEIDLVQNEHLLSKLIRNKNKLQLRNAFAVMEKNREPINN